MKLNSAISNFLTNKLVLHIVSFLALFNVIGHMVIGHYNIVVYFIVIALLVRYFSKNMIVVLGAPLILVNLISMNGGSYMEGFEDGEDANTDTTDKKNQLKENINKKKADSETNNTDDTDDTDATGKNKIAAFKEKKAGETEQFEVGRAKKSGHSIDYATTIEDAYDQLNGILGQDGIKNLTADTERLMQQQTQLAGSLKDMGPLIEKMGPMMEGVKSMMSSMPDGQQGDVMSKVQSMMAGLTKKK